MSRTVTVNGGGMGLPTILTLLFVILKLTHTIAWSWWWVFSPLLISFGIFALFAVAFLIFVGALFVRDII